MSPATIFDIGLAVLVLGVAAWTILVRDTFAAVVSFVVYGLLVALVWVRLSAVDVALTEAAIGSGVTGMLLLGAAARSRWVLPQPRSFCQIPPPRSHPRRWRACRRAASATP